MYTLVYFVQKITQFNAILDFEVVHTAKAIHVKCANKFENET